MTSFISAVIFVKLVIDDSYSHRVLEEICDIAVHELYILCLCLCVCVLLKERGGCGF